MDAGRLSIAARRPRAAEDPDLLRRLGVGAVLAALDRRHRSAREARDARRRRLSRGADRRRADHHAALRAVDDADLPGRARPRGLHVVAQGHGERRGPALGAGAALLLTAAGGRRAPQPLRPHRGGGGRDLLRLPAGGGAVAGADRAADRQHRDPPARPRPPAGGPGGRRRGDDRRRQPRPRVPAPRGADRRALRAASFRRAAGGAPLRDRRPRSPPGGRQRRVPGAHRPPGEDSRLPHRAGGDRGRARSPPGSA